MTATPEDINAAVLEANALYAKYLRREMISTQASRDTLKAHNRWQEALAKAQALQAQAVVYEAEESKLN